jgi:NADH-quinone oxidoreductase subunit C
MTDAFKKGLDDLSGGTRPSEPAAAPSAPPAGELPAHPTVEALRQVFGAELILRHEVAAGDEHVVFVDRGFVFDVLKWLRDTPGHRYDFLQDLTAVDYGGGRRIQVVYQLWSTVNKLNLRLKVELPLDALELPTVYHLWRASDWLEREVYDMFGVVFEGHPDLRRILMPYNYAEGHPLRKDFPLRGRFSRAEQTRRSLSMRTEDHYSPGELETAHLLGQTLPEPFVHGEHGAGPGTAGMGGAH